MPEIPTNARTTIRVTVPAGTELQPWTIEFKPSDPDLVRLYSVDGRPDLIIVEASDREGALTLECYLGLHGTERQPAGSLELDIRSGAADPGELTFDLRG